MKPETFEQRNALIREAATDAPLGVEERLKNAIGSQQNLCARAENAADRLGGNEETCPMPAFGLSILEQLDELRYWQQETDRHLSRIQSTL
jgi:hypothetical protein